MACVYFPIFARFLYNMRKYITKLVLTSIVVLGGLTIEPAKAQDKVFTINQLKLESRADFDLRYNQSDTSWSSGFVGKYLNFAISGNITDKFSYHYRQRINIANVGFSTNFFQGTDWAYLNYMPSDRFTLSAGKQVVAIGGWEYDLAPIDVYFASEFWNNINCYEMGVSAAFHDRDGHNTLLLQVSNSPFSVRALQGIYAYNLQWLGNFGAFKTNYSVNFIEYQKGQFINYIALGNRFDFEHLSFYLDFMNRAGLGQKEFFLEDFSLLGEVRYHFDGHWNAFLKGGLDRNKTQLDVPETEYYDYCVPPGTDYTFYGLGGEYYPIRGKHDVRIHAFFARVISQQAVCQANIGLTWRVNFK